MQYVADKTNPSFDLTALWTFWLVIATLILALITFLLWRVGRNQLGGISAAAKADFIERFSSRFFCSETRSIIMLLNYDALKFGLGKVSLGGSAQPEDFPYFSIDEAIVRQFKISERDLNVILEKKLYSAYEIDDLLLGCFEDISSFENKGLLDIMDVTLVQDRILKVPRIAGRMKM